MEERGATPFDRRSDRIVETAPGAAPPDDDDAAPFDPAHAAEGTAAPLPMAPMTAPVTPQTVTLQTGAAAPGAEPAFSPTLHAAAPANEVANFSPQTEAGPVTGKGGRPASGDAAASSARSTPSGPAAGTPADSLNQALGGAPIRIPGIPFAGMPRAMISRPLSMLSSGSGEGTVEHAGVVVAGQDADPGAVASSGRPAMAAKASNGFPPFATGLSTNQPILIARDPAGAGTPGEAPRHGADFLQGGETPATALLHTGNAGSSNAATSALQAAGRTGAPPMGMVADQVAVRIDRAIETGGDRFTIQLKPAALGQVDIDLKITHDGRVSAVISADRADTLDLLQRDARVLDQALRNAGLHTDSGSLSFSLNGGKYGAAKPETPSEIAAHSRPDLTTDSDPIVDTIAGAAQVRAGSIDIRV
jgi:hypothetical protein